MDVMGLENAVQITGDIGAADAVLALRSKLKSNSWVRGMAKFRQLPIFAIKVSGTVLSPFKMIHREEIAGSLLKPLPMLPFSSLCLYLGSPSSTSSVRSVFYLRLLLFLDLFFFSACSPHIDCLRMCLPMSISVAER